MVIATGQEPAPSPNSPSQLGLGIVEAPNLREIENGRSIVDRDGHQQVEQRISSWTDSRGVTRFSTNRVIQIASGLNYLEKGE